MLVPFTMYMPFLFPLLDEIVHILFSFKTILYIQFVSLHELKFLLFKFNELQLSLELALIYSDTLSRPTLPFHVFVFFFFI